MNPSTLSDTEVLARALWLVDNSLVDMRIGVLQERPEAQLKLRLEALGFRDEYAAERAVKRFYDLKPTLLDNLDCLCQRAFALRQGLPILHTDLLCRRLVRIIDPDILVCFHQRISLPSDDRFDWSAIPLCDDGETSRLLYEDSVDTHIHLGGSLPPQFYWVALMGGELPLETLRLLPKKERGHAPEEQWQQAVARAMRLRFSLARILQREWRRLQHGDRLFPRLPEADAEDFQFFAESFSSDRIPNTEIRMAVLRLSTRWRLKRIGPSYWPFTDPLRTDETVEYHCHYAAGERRLLYHLGNYLRRTANIHAENMLKEYLSIRNAFHEILAYDHGTDGLRRFTETFVRRGFQGGLRRPGKGQGRRQRRRRRVLLHLERSRLTAALDKQLVTSFDADFLDGSNQPLRRIELRVSLPFGHDLLRIMRAWLEGLQTHLAIPGKPFGRSSQMGLLFHLIKGGDGEKAAERADETARRLGHLLKDYPSLRQFIVGLDTAGAERGSPPRTFARAFMRLRTLQAEHRTLAAEPRLRLGWTYHVGEDVDDMLTGLRHLEEVVNILLGPEGGRLGHALVLGEPPLHFYRRRSGQTEPTLGSHLLDLVWAWGRLSDAQQTQDCPWLFNRIQQLGCKEQDTNIIKCYRSMALDNPPSADEKVLLEQELLKQLGVEDGSAGARAITLTADEQWLRVVEQLQKLLRRRLARKPICIEANPTSNLIIGGYNDYSELPYRILVDDHLAVSLNTDDPGLFVTSLPGEFSALYKAFSGSMNHREILAWLADRRFDALQSTFLGRHVPAGSDACRITSPDYLDRLFQYKLG